MKIFILLLLLIFLNTGCAHYPFNPSIKQIDRQTGYRAKFRGVPGNSEGLLFYLTFSGGGTRAAALAYGVLEELKETLVKIDGKDRHLLTSFKLDPAEVDGLRAIARKLLQESPEYQHLLKDLR